MRNWPSDTDEQSACVLAMADEGTWAPQPLPLYDIDGSIILPRDYSSTLAGSFVHIKFMLVRHWVAADSTYHYRACVDEINLIDSTEVDIGSVSHAKLQDSVRTRSSPEPSAS